MYEITNQNIVGECCQPCSFRRLCVTFRIRLRNLTVNPKTREEVSIVRNTERRRDTLSRKLNRLVEKGVLKKTNEGYLVG